MATNSKPDVSLANTEIRPPQLLRLASEDDVVSPLRSPVKRRASPLGDESVRGYANDLKPKYHGAKEIVSVIQTIEDLHVSCCVVGEGALIYYGARRVMFDWIICVPVERLSEVKSTFESMSDKYQPFRPNVLIQAGSLVPHYPRFKLVGQAVFFVLMTTEAVHMKLTPATIEYDKWIRIPYPQLSVYAQALLDTWKLTDLEDLVDGMNLTVQWGEENLELDGNVDQSWAHWKERKLAGRDLQDDELPVWRESKRTVWHKAASTETKKQRQGWKTRADKPTRFWTVGQQDPRERFKDYS